jgi:hypothetical protein
VYLFKLSCFLLFFFCFAQSSKGSPDAIKELVNELLALKVSYKEASGIDFPTPAAPIISSTKKSKAPVAAQEPAQAKSAVSSGKKSENAPTESKVAKPASTYPSEPTLYLDGTSKEDTLKCFFVAELCEKSFGVSGKPPAGIFLLLAVFILFYFNTCFSYFSRQASMIIFHPSPHWSCRPVPAPVVPYAHPMAW